jgi:amino acid permease
MTAAGPFLRKPIWAFLEEENQSTRGTDEGNASHHSAHDEARNEEPNPIYETPSSAPSLPHLPPRHLTLFDLVSIGVGGTIGSGIFVLNGLIAQSYAGPAVFLSWIISGFAALLSGCCYAELSGRIPSTGSSYAYSFVALGELPAFVAAGMLSLEFLLSGSAVAR